jgi:hypothetical protein
VEAELQYLLLQTPNPVLDAKLNRKFTEFIENAHQRQKDFEFYLDRVQDDLMPDLQTKFTMWGCG